MVAIKRSRRPGFSLLELCCVMVIISILIAIVLPALQVVRESSRQQKCKNNLRQLSLGVQNFESANTKFPCGTLGYESDIVVSRGNLPSMESDPNFFAYLLNNQNTSWIVFVLGHLEQNALEQNVPIICKTTTQNFLEYKRMSTNSASIFDVPGIIDSMKVRLPMLVCPSDSISSETIRVNYCGSQPVFVDDLNEDRFMGFRTNLEMARTNYVACAGAYSGGTHSSENIKAFKGVFRSRKQIGFRDVLDGSSNVVLVGENIGSIENGDRTIVNGWMFSMMARGRSDLIWMGNTSTRNSGLQLFGNAEFAHQAGFGSKHGDVVNFAFVDGSVRSFDRGIDLMTLYRACGSSDGEL